MMHLPLARLELDRTARRRTTHRLRLVAPAFCAATLLAAWFVMTWAGSSLPDIANFSGSFVAWTAVTFQLLAACLIAPLFASETLAREKQERTLGLLLLADIRGADLLVSKGLAVFLQVELLILSCLPLQAIASLFGGLSLEMLIAQQIVAAELCFAATCLGLLCSALVWRAIDALFLTLVVEILWGLATYLVDTQYLALPGTGLTNGPLLLVATMTSAFSLTDVWRGLPFTVGPALVLLAVALLRIPKLTDEPAATARTWQRGKPTAEYFKGSAGLFRLGPVGRLYAANVVGAGGAMYRWPWWPLVMAGSMVLAWGQPQMVFLLVLVLAVYDVTSSLTAVRFNGGLDLLYITGADDETLARGIVQTHVRRAFLYFPALVIAGAWIGYSAVAPVAHMGPTHMMVLLFVAVAALRVLSALVSLIAFANLGCFASTIRYGPIIQTCWALFAFLAVLIIIKLVALLLSLIITVGAEFVVDMSTVHWALASRISEGIVAIILWLNYAARWRGAFTRTIKRSWRTGGILDAS